jgi:hypothetical protein
VKALSDEAIIKTQNEAKMMENNKKEAEESKPQRVPLDQRFRQKLHGLAYGDKKADDKEKK